MGWTFKLISGTNTLDLSAGSPGTAGYGIRDATIDSPAGSDTMTLTLNFYTEAANQTEVVRRLEAQINQYLKWARAYESRERADPVEFWVLPNDGVGIEPTFGAVSRRRLVLGGSIVPPYGGPGMAYQGTTIPGYTLTLRCRPFWHGLTHWMMCGTGGIIEDTANQGLHVWEGTTNLCEYPNDQSGWFTEAGASVAALNSAAQRIYGATRSGLTGIRMYTAASLGDIFRIEVASPAQSASYTMSAYVRGRGAVVGDATPYIAVTERIGAAASSTVQVFTPSTSWQRVQVSRVIVNASVDDIIIGIQNTAASNSEIHLCDIQLENKGYITPYADGNSGLGCRWSGSAGKSTSTRQVATLYGSAYNGVVNPAAGTVSMWVRASSWATPTTSRYLFDIASGVATNRITLYTQTANTLVAAIWNAADTVYVIEPSISWVADTWYHVVFCWQRNDMRLYVNGASVGTPITSAIMPTLLPSKFFAGCFYDPAYQYQLNGTIHSDFRIYGQALTAAQVASLYAAGRGPGCLPYTATLEAGGMTDPPSVHVFNHEDSGTNHQNWVQLGNVPGDEESPMRWWISTEKSATTFHHVGAIYYGLRKYQGDQAVFSVSPYNCNATTDADTTVVADSTSTYGYKYRVTPSDNTWDAWRISATIPNMPGRWHAYLRVIDSGAALGIWHTRIEITSGGTTVYYPDSAGATAPAIGAALWSLVDLGEIELPPSLGGLTPTGGNLNLYIWAKRDSGATTHDIDCLLLAPAENCGKLGDPTSTWTRSSFQMDNIDYEPHTLSSINATFYPDTYATRNVGKWYGQYLTLTPQSIQRMMFMSLDDITDYSHNISGSKDMDFAAQIEPHYSSPW